jgi:hypothetical protein
MLLVDSTVWIDYFNGLSTNETQYLDSALGNQEILVGDLIIAEVLQGFRDDHDFELARDAFNTFRVVSLVNQELALQSALNDRLLRKKGVTVRKTIDSLIATFCIENTLSLLHNDTDYLGYEKFLGLQVIHA